MTDGLSELTQIEDESGVKMEGALSALDDNFRTVRTGRASPSALDNVHVSAYGSDMPLNQVANVSTPDARTIVISPWDKGQLSAIERAIIAANLGFNPSNDGVVIRISVPPLTEERRKEFVKQAHKMAEEARIAIRHVRKHANDNIKRLEKDHGVPEDIGRQAHDRIQKLTDEYIAKVDEKMKKKEKEIMEV
ncbi:MAG: ribosome recycling factor [Candidatus Sumerlaeota bacterium]|nr:ribosome recycling factor [Candidatus Sumerlaeota bacterium]